MLRSVLSIVLLSTLVACSTNSLPQSAKDLPSGDADRGADLFSQSISGAPACSSCHRLDDTTLVGPGFKGLGAAAGTRISGISANEYIFQSIIHPSAHIVSGFGNLMYDQYAQRLNAQQIADLVAYLLTR